MNTTVPPNTNDAENLNILFECPQCGKSLEIDARGAGYIIVCPDCKNEIQVPAWNSAGPEAEVDSETETESESDERYRVEIEEMLQQLQGKIARIEKQQLVDDQCFKRIGDEIVLIQSALDRITEVVETRKATS